MVIKTLGYKTLYNTKQFKAERNLCVLQQLIQALQTWDFFTIVKRFLSHTHLEHKIKDKHVAIKCFSFSVALFKKCVRVSDCARHNTII